MTGICRNFRPPDARPGGIYRLLPPEAEADLFRVRTEIRPPRPDILARRPGGFPMRQQSERMSDETVRTKASG
jgi:hypothetical protein